MHRPPLSSRPPPSVYHPVTRHSPTGPRRAVMSAFDSNIDQLININFADIDKLRKKDWELFADVNTRDQSFIMRASHLAEALKTRGKSIGPGYDHDLVVALLDLFTYAPQVKSMDVGKERSFRQRMWGCVEGMKEREHEAAHAQDRPVNFTNILQDVWVEAVEMITTEDPELPPPDIRHMAFFFQAGGTCIALALRGKLFNERSSSAYLKLEKSWEAFAEAFVQHSVGADKKSSKDMLTTIKSLV